MKVLLFANIGTASNNFYHVGDEAMFLETYNWYQKHHPKYKLSALVSQPNHANLEISEITNPLEFQFINRKTLFKVILKTKILNLLNINLLTQKEDKLVSIIKSNNRIHFCGGGNITSLFSGWLYYSLLIIEISSIFKKEIILTSQTIGPFNYFDKIISKIILNKSKIIATRGNIKEILSLNLKHPKLLNMLDAAYNLPIKSNIKIPPQKNFRIGLSLHQWNENHILIRKIIKILSKINNHKKIEIVLIPHIIVNEEKEWDMGFMQSFFKNKNKIKIIKPKIKKILSSKPEVAFSIKNITSKCDLLITTRYHGLVFALSKNIPVLTFTEGEYYSNKNNNILKLYYPKKYHYYTLNKKTRIKEIYQKIYNIIQNNQEEKKYLKRINFKLQKNYDLFFNNLGQKILN